MRIHLSLIVLAALSVSSVAQFKVLVAETSAGAVGPFMGVRRYDVAGTGGAATLGNGIAAGSLSDPAGLAFGTGGDVFVGNRHGNASPSSISRFVYDSGTDSYVANGTITGNSLFGVHGINFAPNGELFASNVNGPISRFTFPGGVPTANGTMGSGPARDVFLSADGRWGYVTQGVSANLLKYDLATGNLVNTFAIAGGGGLHNGSWYGSDLYIAAFSGNAVAKIQFDANGDVVGSSTFASAAPISLDFSPDGQEMFVASHTSGLITRYANSGGSWVQSGTINVGVNLGDIIVYPQVPEPATLGVLGLGMLALARRRRKL